MDRHAMYNFARGNNIVPFAKHSHITKYLQSHDRIFLSSWKIYSPAAKSRVLLSLRKLAAWKLHSCM